MTKTEKLERALNDRTTPKPIIPDDAWLSTGISTLNMAISGRVNGGITKGHYIWFLGDSESGKSAFALKVLAEASINPHFDKHRLIYEDVETGIFQFPIAKFYGKRLAQRIEPLVGTKKEPESCVTIQNFYRRAFAALKSGPCIIVADSMDGLDDEEELSSFKKASEKNEASKSTYGMGKAKANSTNIKRLISCLALFGSILIVINQTRENLERVNAYSPKTKPGAGGKALRFYSHVQLWSSLGSALKKEIAGKKRTYGNKVFIAVKKNRVCGWSGSIEVTFLRDVGFDETGSAIDYLTSEGYWKRAKGLIRAKEFKCDLDRSALIEKIESQQFRIDRLKSLVEKHWKEIDSQLVEKRRNPYQ